MKTWSGPELRTFLDSAVNERLYAAFLLAATTGMRRGEVLGLHWRDLDLDASRASVTQTLIAVRGELTFSTPKTAKGRRLVALDAFTVAALREHRRSQLVERLALGSQYLDADLVFCQENGEPVHPDRFSDLFNRLVKAAALPRIRLHI